MWEFEKQLDSVVPNARIPAYDWASEDLPMRNEIWSATRLGGNNYGAAQAAAIPDGPFQGTAQRQANPIGLFSRQSINDGVTSLDGYASFNTWFEAVHGSFHVSLGGDMRRTGTAPIDVAFYLHHAFVGKSFVFFSASE